MGSLPVLILYVGAIFGIIWLLFVLPQRRLRRQQQEMLDRLSPGDEVVTAGGIYGTLTEIEDGDTVLIEVAEDTEIRVAKASIARILTDVGGTVSGPATDGTTE